MAGGRPTLPVIEFPPQEALPPKVCRVFEEPSASVFPFPIKSPLSPAPPFLRSPRRRPLGRHLKSKFLRYAVRQTPPLFSTSHTAPGMRGSGNRRLQSRCPSDPVGQLLRLSRFRRRFPQGRPSLGHSRWGRCRGDRPRQARSQRTHCTRQIERSRRGDAHPRLTQETAQPRGGLDLRRMDLPRGRVGRPLGLRRPEEGTSSEGFLPHRPLRRERSGRARP